MNKELILERIQTLCKERNIPQTTAFTESGVGKNFRSNFKTANPSEGKLTMLANYFGVSVSYLKGETDEITIPPATGEFSEHEREIIFAYRSQPDMQAAVDRLLGVEQNSYIRLYTAAHSTDNRPDKIIYMNKNQWEKIQQAKETDDPLL